jgi:hypothetical protein
MSKDNTDYIINWSKRMMKKTGLCGAVLCEVLAEHCGESGNEYPSFYAVETASEWEKDLTVFLGYVKKSYKWCMRPTWGCIHLCEFWKQGKLDKLVWEIEE